MEKAWGQFYQNQELSYRDECLRSGLPAELEDALAMTDKKRILVVACHACQHLSEETIEIATSQGVNVSVMPCCQRDRSGGAWKSLGKQIGIGIGPLMDVLLAGKAMSASCGKDAGVSYNVKIKLIDEKITPQNRIIMCKASSLGKGKSREDRSRDASHDKLERAYIAAHRVKKNKKWIFGRWRADRIRLCAVSAMAGLCIGIVATRSRLR